MKKNYKLMLLAMLCLVMLPAITKAITNTDLSITVGTTTRTMKISVPDNLPDKSALILSLHGAGQDPAYQQNMAQWGPIADQEKFLVVFPQGINNQWDISGTSDINFMLAIIDEMVTRYKIDPNRVYLSGFSMGGMFTYHAMTQIADKIAAFAPISGYLMGNPIPNSSRPIPIIHTHGTSDDVVPYNAGNSPANGVYFSGIESIMAGWAAKNNCPSTAQITDPYPSSNANSSCTKKYWGLGDNGVEVVLMSIEGKGHWISIDPVNGINTSLEIWNFCKRFSLNLTTPQVKFTSPAKNSVYTMYGTETTWSNISFAVNATDPDGTISKVEFYSGSTLLQTDDTAPYEFDWSNVPAGTNQLTAIATDNEGNTGQSTTTIQIDASPVVFNLSSGFTSSGVIPIGWTTYDGATLRTGPLSGLSSGCRILQMTGATRDFNYGMYIRNTNATVKGGYLAYAVAGSGAELYLAPGNYKLNYTCTNWNMAAFGDIICQVQNQQTQAEIASLTIKPQTSIGNNTANNFSGSSQCALPFTVTDGGLYMIKFYTADASWADAIITNVSMSIDSNTTSLNDISKSKTIKEIKYFSVTGIELPKPVSGLVIKQVLYEDGTTESVKTYVR